MGVFGVQIHPLQRYLVYFYTSISPNLGVAVYSTPKIRCIGCIKTPNTSNTSTPEYTFVRTLVGTHSPFVEKEAVHFALVIVDRNFHLAFRLFTFVQVEKIVLL